MSLIVLLRTLNLQIKLLLLLKQFLFSPLLFHFELLSVLFILLYLFFHLQFFLSFLFQLLFLLFLLFFFLLLFQQFSFVSSFLSPLFHLCYFFRFSVCFTWLFTWWLTWNYRWYFYIQNLRNFWCILPNRFVVWLRDVAYRIVWFRICVKILVTQLLDFVYYLLVSLSNFSNMLGNFIFQILSQFLIFHFLFFLSHFSFKIYEKIVNLIFPSSMLHLYPFEFFGLYKISQEP